MMNPVVRASLLAFSVAALNACTTKLSSYQETLVAGCIESAIEKEFAPLCKDVDGDMEEAFLEAHPGYKEAYVASQKATLQDHLMRNPSYEEASQDAHEQVEEPRAKPVRKEERSRREQEALQRALTAPVIEIGGP